MFKALGLISSIEGERAGKKKKKQKAMVIQKDVIKRKHVLLTLRRDTFSIVCVIKHGSI